MKNGKIKISSLGKNLQNLAESNRLTQREVARIGGVSSATVNKLYHDPNSFKALIAIANIANSLNVSIDSLFFDPTGKQKKKYKKEGVRQFQVTYEANAEAIDAIVESLGVKLIDYLRENDELPYKK